MRALTEFLVREALALLLDDPTPRRVALAMGDAPALESQPSESQLSEDSESQGLAAVAPAAARVMMVRKTDSAHQRVSLVDRSVSVEAFVPKVVADALCQTHGYKSLARLRGSVVRVDKYHFATSTPSGSTPSVSTRHAHGDNRDRLWLVVEALTVIDETEAVVNAVPRLDEHAAVAKQLAALAPAALEQRLVLRQGLALAPSATPATSDERVTPSPAKRFGEHVPLLDHECEVPEDQERALDAQEGWADGPTEPTDSQLIAENGPVASSGESQGIGSSGTTILPSNNTAVPSSSDSVTPQETGVSTKEPQASAQSPPQSQGVEPSPSVADSQDFHFQQVNLKNTFIDCSDTDSDNEEYVLAAAQPAATTRASQSELPQQSTPSKKASPSRRANSTPRRSARSTAASSQATESQSRPSQASTESEQPLTQAPALSASLPLSETQTDESPSLPQASQSEASQPTGEFVGVVRADHDEPMTQAGDADESQATMSQVIGSAKSVEWNTQAPDASQLQEIASDQETVDVEYEMGQDEDPTTNIQGQQDEEEEEELEDRPTASQQDGQADHWMDTQPTDSSPAKRARRRSEEASPSPSVSSQRRKRRRTLVPSPQTRALSPQEPSAKAAQRDVSETTTTTTSTTAPTRTRLHTVNSASLSASSDSVASTSRAMLAFNRTTARDPQRQRLPPSKRYQHLLPPFDLDAICRQISDKTE